MDTETNFAGAGLASATGFSLNNKGYIGTGFSPGDNAEALDFWEYTPGTNSWVPKANLAITGSQARQAAVGFSIGTKGYIGTGLRNTMLKNFFEYDPVANAWTQKADFGGSARYYAVGFSIGTKGYIGTGGTGGSTYLKDFWEYNQASYSTPSYSSLSPAISNTEITDGIWTKTILNEIISTGGNIKISQNGNLGIGTSAPGFPLNFPNTLSDKISLYGNSGSHYGFGIQGGLLQIYTDAAPSSIAFGYGSSDAFTETMRIRRGECGYWYNYARFYVRYKRAITIDQKNFGGYGGMLLKGNIPGSNYPNIAFSIKNTAAADVVAAIVQGDLLNNTAGAESIDLTFSTSQSGFGSL
ncbi:MAG: hypothetical protein IPP96_17825 [Chitinophagaceae bacterium]|nr:hypothetical protein [Chitinophagaceae bacterium]